MGIQLPLLAPDFIKLLTKPFVMSKRVSVSLAFQWKRVAPGGFCFSHCEPALQLPPFGPIPNVWKVQQSVSFSRMRKSCLFFG